jgi:hypothetical protein
MRGGWDRSLGILSSGKQGSLSDIFQMAEHQSLWGTPSHSQTSRHPSSLHAVPFRVQSSPPVTPRHSSVHNRHLLSHHQTQSSHGKAQSGPTAAAGGTWEAGGAQGGAEGATGCRGLIAVKWAHFHTSPARYRGLTAEEMAQRGERPLLLDTAQGWAGPQAE